MVSTVSLCAHPEEVRRQVSEQFRADTATILERVIEHISAPKNLVDNRRKHLCLIPSLIHSEML
jgi:hypothetical protein